MVNTDLHFDTIEELSEWLTENNKSLSDLVISEHQQTLTWTTTGVVGADGSHCTTCESAMSTTIPTWEPKEITIKSLNTQPNIKQVPLDESTENDPYVWYVDDYEYIQDACGTNRVTYKGNTLLMNVCESNGNAMASLIVEIDGKVSTIKFKLDKTCNSPKDYDMILSC